MWKWIRSTLFAITAGVSTAQLPIWVEKQWAIAIFSAILYFFFITALDQAAIDRAKAVRRERRKGAACFYELREMNKSW